MFYDIIILYVHVEWDELHIIRCVRGCHADFRGDKNRDVVIAARKNVFLCDRNK